VVRATPCIGICSTTYGDLVCRGCKRFAHEIVSWNAYTPEQRIRVRERLDALRDQSTATFVAIADPAMLHATAASLRLNVEPSASALTVAYEVLRRRAREMRNLRDAGLHPVGDVEAPLEVRDAIDAEFHIRSIAHFERSFRVPVDS